jgi:hypothetical protein
MGTVAHLGAPHAHESASSGGLSLLLVVGFRSSSGNAPNTSFRVSRAAAFLSSHCCSSSPPSGSELARLRQPVTSATMATSGDGSALNTSHIFLPVRGYLKQEVKSRGKCWEQGGETEPS